MSMYISLNINDYKRVMDWFELAFARIPNGASDDDNETFRKITVMLFSKMEVEGRHQGRSRFEDEM